LLLSHSLNYITNRLWFYEMWSNVIVFEIQNELQHNWNGPHIS
jgi:hypothetical protein